jgi:hypothetical protein
MSQSLTAGIPYTVNTGETLVNETFGPNNIRRRRTGKHELRTMPIHNGRALAGALHAAHFVRRPTVAARCAAAAKHRGARLRVFLRRFVNSFLKRRKSDVNL